MFRRKLEPTNVEHISDAYSLDWKFGANSVADGYRAHDKLRKRHCSLWITRGPLTEETRRAFFGHIQYLRKGGLERISAYGCDVDGIGFVALPVLAAKRLDYDAPLPMVKARRYLLALLKVESLHLQGIVCGNLCVDSFMLDSEEELHFVGYVGGHIEKEGSFRAEEYDAFVPPEADGSNQSSQAADAYALAVIGLKLFGAQFPGGRINLSDLPECLKTLDSKAPLWLRAVLPRVLTRNSDQRYKDASELLAAISVQLESQRQLTAEGHDYDTSSQDLREESQVMRNLPRAWIRRQARIRNLLRSRIFVITTACALLGLLGGIAWAISASLSESAYTISANERAGLLSDGGILLDPLGGGNQGASPASSLGQGLRALFGKESIRPEEVNIGLGQGGKVSPIGSGRQESPQGVDSGVIGAADQRRDSPLQDSLVGTPIPSVRWEAQLTRAKQAGFGHTVEVLGYLVNTPHGIRPTDIDSLFGVLTPTLTKEGRRELVLSYEPIDADLSYMLAAALTLDLSDPGLFRELLVRGAQKQIGVNRSPVDVTSTFALMVAIPSVREFFLDDATKESLTLSKDDTWWIFETLIAQRAEQLPKFVRSTRMNQLAEGPRRFFVLSLGQVADPEGVPMAALLRSARDGPTAADVQQFSQWFDPISVQALLAALLTSSEAQVITNALDALANKSTGSRPLDAALAFMNNNVAALRVYYARFIGAVGLVEGLSVEERRDALASIRGKPQTSQLCKIVLQASDATLARAILDAFGNDMNPALLVDLLQHPDKGVRLQVIPFVKSVQLASSWQQVVNSYLAELDPEVKSRYETEIPRIRGS